MKTISTLGIIVYAKPFFEKDKIIELLTPHHGKIRCIVKRLYGKKKANTGTFELGNTLHAIIQKGKSFHYINQATLEPHPAIPYIRREYNKINLLFYYCAIIRSALETNQPNPEIFALLKHHIQHLAHATHIQKCQHAFETDFLTKEGLLDRNHTQTESFKELYYQYTGKTAPILTIIDT